MHLDQTREGLKSLCKKNYVEHEFCNDYQSDSLQYYSTVNTFQETQPPKREVEMEDLFSLSDYLSVVMYSPISPYELYFVHKINGIRIYLRNGIKTLCYLEHLNDP